MKNGFPDHFVHPSRKNKTWISQYIRAAYDEYRKLYPNGFFNAIDKYESIQTYMKGRQSISKYQRMIDPHGFKNKDESWLKVDWSILPIVPKFRRIALETLNKQLFDTTAEVTDPIAQEEREKFYRQKEANIMMRDALEANGMGDKVAALGMTKEDPQDMDELKMHMKYGYKNQYAIEMESTLNLVNNVHNNMEKIREKCREDLFDYGCAFIKEYLDPFGYIKLRKTDVRDMIVAYTKEEDGSDARHIGEIRQMTLNDIVKESKDKISVEKLKEIADNHHDKFRNPTAYDGREYMDYRVQVLDMEFMSVNPMTFEKRTNKAGNKVVGRSKPTRSKKNKYSTVDYDVVYKGMWVVGTDLFFNCELATDMKRPKDNLSATKMSFHMIAPGLHNMQLYSMGEQVQSIADQIQIAWYKLQQAVINSIPNGVAIEMAALENIPLGKGGKKLTATQSLDLLFQRGVFAFRGVDERGNPIPYDVFKPVQLGLGDEASKWYNLIDGHIQKLRDIVGFNEITDGSTPDPRTLKGVANLSVNSTNNSIAYLHRGEKHLIEDVNNDLTLRIQDSLAKGTVLKGYIKPLGETTTKFFQASKDLTRFSFGVRMVERPTEQEKERLAVRIEKAIDKEQITVADAVFVENFTNINMAEQMLAYRVEKNREKQQQVQQQSITLTAQQQQKSAAMAENEKRKTLQLEHQLKMVEKQFDAKEQVRIELLKKSTKLEEAKTIANTDIAKKKMEVESNEYLADKKVTQTT